MTRYPAAPNNPHLPDTSRYPIFEGKKRYELTNHLGNPSYLRTSILAVVTDRKRGRSTGSSAIQWFEADVLSAQQYYPFGMLMPGSGTVTNHQKCTTSLHQKCIWYT
ncbi:MAG: hypothetical protein SFV52_06470 [Saprospiraceae bacterium]|nr:hypothetical protein [Saprospiraceae bacterium]